MELDGMNKISQDKRCAVLSPNASCQKHLFSVLPCETVPEAAERVNLLSSTAQAVGINCSYSNEPRDVSVLKASLRTQMENHLNSFSPAPEIDTPFVEFPRGVSLAGETAVVSETTVSSQPNLFKYPCDHDNHGSFNLKEANSTAFIGLPPSSSGSDFFTSDSVFVNGSTATSLLCSAESATPMCDTSLDINGHSGSHTPASPNDSDRVRMDLSKLDETIDYVLSNARSEHPCEGMFVLSCRNKELTHLSSPTFRANTPSSGHLVSPSPPPTPSSPHSHHVTSSPFVHSTNRPHAFLQSCVSNVNVTHSLQRYVVDQGTGLVQFSPFNMNSQCIPSQRNTQQPVSFVHLYSDPGPLRVQVSERAAYSSTCPPTPVVLHQNVQRTIQNHLTSPTRTNTLAYSVAGQSNNFTTSPSKINFVQAVTTQVSKLATVSQLNPTIYQPLETTVASSNQPLLLSPPASMCCFVQNSNTSAGLTTGAVALGFPNGMAPAINCSSLLPVERNAQVQSPISVSFRQPTVPTQPPVPPYISSQTSISPVVPDQIIPAVTSISSTSQRTRVAAVAVPSGLSRKRGSSSLTAGSKRRRTTAVSPTLTGNFVSPNKILPESTFPGKSNQVLMHECSERLKLTDSKSLVSAPVLKPYGTVLPPSGASDSILLSLSQREENSMLKRRGLKYHRGMMSLRIPKCFLSGSLCENVDCYITRHLQPNTPIGPMVHESLPCFDKCAVANKGLICPSPEPVTFENHMMTFFSSIQQSPKDGNKTDLYAGSSALGTSPTGSALLTPKLLPIFSDASSSTDKPDPQRSTPPLPLCHIPNPKLISGSPVFGIDERSTFPFHDPSSRSPITGFSTSNYLHRGSPLYFRSSSAMDTGTPEYNPMVDSETGEVMARRNPPSESLSPDTLEKLNITFTINPSVSGDISKIVRRVAELVGVDQGSVCYQVTRSGAQITLDQKHSEVESIIYHLESQLREHFNPISLHFDTSLADRTVPSQQLVHRASPHFDTSETVASPLPKFSTDTSICELDAPGIPVLEPTIYSEEPVSIVSLLSSKHVIAKPCQCCDKIVAPGNGVRKNSQDVAALTGLTPRSDALGEVTFCSDDCLSRFSRLVFSRRPSCFEFSGFFPSEATMTSFDTRSHSLAFDLASSVPVLLQSASSKTIKGLKRQHTCPSIAASGSRKRAGLLSHCYSKYKRWKGVRWRIFSPESPPTVHSGDSLPTDKLLPTFRYDKSVLRLPSTGDPRACALCWVKGDAPEGSLGRLLPLDVDQWLHLNCALWCYEVYETVGGSLNNVKDWLKKAKDTNCSHCGRFGAGLPCYNPRCTFVYHVPCALSIGCMFFTDRGMYCPQHQPREAHPMQLLSLTVNRRVYIARDENAQIGSVIHEEDRTSVIRIGTLSLHSVGQLLPHQLESGYFHNRRYIYPVGFRSTRIYWSMRIPQERARYLCEIIEMNGRPLFRVTASDRDMPDECVEHENCADAWRLILTKVEQLRNGSKFLRLFYQHLKGEDMYGLSEPHVVRAIESLPGVDSLRDYVFNFGRMELISEMPLAINPSGCARSEPKMQTYVKRSTPHPLNGIVSTPSRSLLPGIRRPVYPSLSLSNTTEFSKQYQSSRSQQYRRLKGEASSNVILGRSRIQGLGLFAARELEPQTMVIEYIGELIRIELSNKREKEYEAQHRGIYMFRLDHDTVIDATMCGGLARYVNHSCQPNCFAEYLNFGDRSHIVIITNRRIEKGEELCYDYNFDLEDGGSKIPCLCRSVNCRKWMN